MWMNNVMFQHNESDETSDVALVNITLLQHKIHYFLIYF